MSRTPLAEKLSSSAARLGEYRGAETPLSFSGQGAEFAALRSACGVYDLGWRAQILVTGPDRGRWLNGMVTNNVRDLAAGQGVYNFLLNSQGRVLADLYAFNRGDYILVDTDRAQGPKVLEIFDHYIIMDEVEVKDAGEGLTAMGVQGPNLGEVLRAAGIELQELAPLQLTERKWRAAAITVARMEAEKAQVYQVWLAPEVAGLLWDALREGGAIPVGTEALNLFRVAAGIPQYGQDIRERDLPQETGQQRALNFSKGCYLGQEIVERIRSRGQVHRSFTGFRLQGPLPPPGTKVEAEGKEVGEVTSVASLPTGNGDLPVALGYIRREAGLPGRAVEIGGVKATVAQPPFVEL